MKARNFLWISVVNIFLLLLISLLMEYGDLRSRFQSLQNTISNATDSAIRTSTTSEELFTYKYKYANTSSSGVTDGVKTSGSQLKILGSGNTWISGNTYVMSMFYEKYGRFPKTQYEYDSYATDKYDTTIYEWLYGKIGSEYRTSKYSWANRMSRAYNNLSLWTGIGTDRTPTSKFLDFYNSIGYLVDSTTLVKVKNGSSYYTQYRVVPTLSLMGLNLSSYNSNLNITSDYLSGSIHFGKASNGVANTSYYFTPYSLGITYIPTEVLKPSVLSHIEQLVRYGRLREQLKEDDYSNDFSGSTGCIETSIYQGSNTYTSHLSSNSSIINDGEVEYDLSSLKVKVDYMRVFYYDYNNYLLVNKIEGSTSQYDSNGKLNITYDTRLNTLPARLSSSDTSKEQSGIRKSYRIVAKVSVKLKVHIPYKSPILQWFRYLTDKDGTNHYDIRLWDEQAENIDVTSDGVWFTYSTYYGITR